MAGRNYKQDDHTPLLTLSEEEMHSASLVLAATSLRIGASEEDLNVVLLALGLKDYPEESSG